jgi:hypothetical protein
MDTIETFDTITDRAAQDGIDLDVNEYVFSHGHEPRNEYGCWFIRNTRTGECVQSTNWLVNVLNNFKPGTYEILP